MACRTERTEIAGVAYEVTQLPYFRAQRLFVRLLKTAGPALTAAATLAGQGGGAQAVGALLDADAGQLAGALGELFARLEPDEVEAISREILATARVHVEGRVVDLAPVMDAVLGGDFWSGLKLQAFALKVHFGGFSGARDALGALGRTAAASRSPESTTSTGSRATS